MTTEEPTPAQIALDADLVLTRMVARWAHDDPGRPFLLEIDGANATYGDFHVLIARWCAWLTDLGVERGSRIGSFLPPSIDAYALWLATCYLGAVEVSINAELTGEFLAHVLADSGVDMCFCRPEEPVLSELDGVDVQLVDRDDSPALRFAPAELPPSPTPNDTCCVIYTSGSTGPAKGAVVTWAQMNATIGRIPRSWLAATDVSYAFYPMFHVTGRSPLPPMADVGGQVVLRERFSLAEFWPEVRRFVCTITSIGPPLGLLLGAPARADDADNPLHTCLAGSGNPLVNLFADRFCVRVIGAYGSTEIGFPLIDRGETPAEAGRLGWLRPDYELRIVDHAGVDVEPGVGGEAWIKPPVRELMMSGYVGPVERTDRAIVDGWYRTGDLMMKAGDGSAHFLGRVSETIRRFGENISSVALESVVKTDPDVGDCVVLGIPSDVSGEEVVLVVAPRAGVDLDPADLYGRLETRLAKHMRPAYVDIRSSLPRTPSGKIDRAVLKDGVGSHSNWASPAAIVRA